MNEHSGGRQGGYSGTQEEPGLSGLLEYCDFSLCALLFPFSDL